MFSDHQIKSKIEKKYISISPYDATLVQPASVDLRLGSEFIKYNRSSEPIDPEAPDESVRTSFSVDRLILYPGDFVLGTTLERVGICPAIAARVEGKSTLGRLGLIVHSTAGFVDPGFKGNITLEMTNINVRPIILRAGMKICQIAFYKMDSAARVPYGHKDLGSHYHNQSSVTPAAPLLRIL